MAEVNVRVSDSGRLFPDAVVIKVDEQEIIAGQDGISPVVTVTEIGTAEAVSSHGYEVYVSDAAGVHTYSVYDGASAYAQAVAGGYSGTEEEFAADLIGFNTRAAEATSGATAAAAYADAASDSATAAATSESNAADSATAAASSASEAASSAGTATTAAGSASSSATAAAGSATTASNKASEAASSESNAASSATAASASATAAAASETAAASSASSAASSATAAAASATAIEEYEHDAEAWAIGKRGGVDVDSSDDTYHNNSKYYAEHAAASSSAASSAASEASQSATEAASEAESSKSYSRSAYISSTMASGSATAAADAQTAAETAAATAEGHATNAASSATAASGSATAAGNAQTAAEDAQTAAETAQAAAEDAQDAAEAAAQSIAQSAAQIAQNTSDVDDLKSVVNDKAPIIINSASGDIAHFEDGADNMPIKQLTVNVEPIQDLHGYDNPWPAGGGKNKLEVTSVSETQNGVTITVNSDGTISLSGTATDQVIFGVGSVALSGEYILSGCPSGGNYSTYFLYCVNYDYGSGATVTFDGTRKNVQLYVRSGINTNGLVFKPMIRLSSVTDATFAPYSNICPISGRTGVNVWDDPVYGGNIEWNQHAKSIDSTEWRGSGAATVVFDGGEAIVTNLTQSWQGIAQRTSIQRIQNHKYLVSAYARTVENNTTVSIGTGVLAPVTTIGTVSSTTNTRISTITQNTGDSQTVTLNIGNRNGTASFAVSKVQVFDLTQMFGEGNEPTIEQFDALFPADSYSYNEGEVTTVSAVNGDPYSRIDITFPTEAGTVYGGTLDVTQGKMVVDRAMVELSENWYWYIGGTQPSGKTVVTTASFPAHVYDYNFKTEISSHFYMGDTPSSRRFIVDMGYLNFILSETGNAAFFCFKNEAGGTVQEFKDYIVAQRTAGTPIQVTYELATPIEITLTPTQITTLLGTNNIWSDAGDVSVDYRADTKLYIDNIHTPTDEDMTADAQIASGKYFLIGGNLYKSTTVIPAGDTIIPGTNCIKTNLAEALNALNA